jgi:hypothetical protein
MSSPATAVRAALKTIIEAEFAGDNVTVFNDKLHESLGDGSNVCGIYPDSETENPEDVNMQITEVTVQMFMSYLKDVDPYQIVDPALIEDWADRFRKSVLGPANLNIPEAWFFRIVRIDYPMDPTGNKSRFTAVVRAYGNNSSQI